MGNDRDLTGALRVLAVNHNSILREGLRIFIDTQPNVRLSGSVADADEAVVHFSEARPDLTLVDLNLPFGRGIDVIRRIRAIDSDAWIIGLVTYEWDNRSGEAIDAGASAVLPKDLIADKLMQMILIGPQVCQPGVTAVTPVRSSSRWRTFVRAFLLHRDSRV